jgi:acyl-CoA synthetase (AMP-forming)/AMP-acid ligase II
MNIATILQQIAATHPDLPAIIDTHRGQNRTTTFAELEKAGGEIATLLQQAGLQAGDAVLVFYPMSAELYIILAALFRLGLIAMFLDPGVSKDHVERCCALYPPKALIASNKAHLLRLFVQALRRIPLKFAIGCFVPGAISLKPSPKIPYSESIFPCTQDTPALLTFTSGSTGKPKAALRTHEFLLAQHEVLASTLQLKVKEIDLTTLPIFVLANLASGVTSLIPNTDLRKPGAIKAAPVIAQIQTHKPVRAVASPAFLLCLAQYCQEHNLTLPSLKKIFVGGATVMPKTLAQLQQTAPNAEFIIVYGSTEAEPIAHINHNGISPEDLAATITGHGVLVGKPESAIAVRIIGDRWGTPIKPLTHREFTAACLPPDTPGEIVVSGKYVLSSYLNGYGNEETKFTVDRIPWHRTGDAGYIDKQGRLWFLGRCIGCIKDTYGSLYPLAIEGIVENYPGIRRSAAVLHQGARILVVELDKSREVVDWASLQKSLASMNITTVKVCKKIPLDKRHNAKIDYPALFQLLNSLCNN